MRVLTNFFAVFILLLSLCGVSSAQDPADIRPITERKLLNQDGLASPNIYEIEMKPKALRKIQTALNYFTVIDSPEKVLNVYIGNQELFKVEVYEKQVLIKPLTEDTAAQTNLLVITESGRFVFEITVGPPETAEFVIDGLLGEDIIEDKVEKAIKEKEGVLNEKYQTKEKELEKEAQKIADQKIKENISLESKVINLKASKANRDVQVNLLSLSKIGNRMYLRFSVLNFSKTPYRVLKTLIGRERSKSQWLKEEKEGLVESESESSLPELITPNQYVYGVLSFDEKALAKDEKPVFRILESEGTRNIEIRGFAWI